jgi:Tfp pilus assembly protein PilO
MKGLKVFAELSMARLVVVAILATVGYFYMYYDDGSAIEAQKAGVSATIAGEKMKRVEIERKMKKEEEMRGNLLQLARNLDIVKSKIPNEFNEIEISSIVNRVSGISRVQILALKRSVQNGTAASIGKKNMTGAELIEEVSFNIDMIGNFSSIIEFVELLSKEEKTIKIRNFTLEKNSPGYSEENLIKFRGEIVGFKQAFAANGGK